MGLEIGLATDKDGLGMRVQEYYIGVYGYD